MQYTEYLRTDQWRQRRRGCLLRSHRKCEACKVNSRLHVHHLTYARLFSEPLDDLMVLCHLCHRLIEDHYKAGRITKEGDPKELRAQTLVLLDGQEELKKEQAKQRRINREKKEAERKAAVKLKTQEAIEQGVPIPVPKQQKMKGFRDERRRLWEEARQKHGKPQSKIESHYYKLGASDTQPKIRY